MNKIAFILIGIIFISCAQKREKELIDDYHQKAIEIKGDSALFVSKETVKSFILKYYEVLEVTDIKVGDNISFFDDDGNIFYQVNCVSVADNSFYVNCLNLTTKKYYKTLFNVDNIIDLKDKQIESIKVLRK